VGRPGRPTLAQFLHAPCGSVQSLGYTDSYSLNVDLMPGPANALERYIASDTKRWGEATKGLNLALE
jgi:hypothetical protein